MAYMNQERKQKIVASLKTALAGTGVKYSVAVHNHSTIVFTFISGPVDFRKHFTERARSVQVGDPYNYSINPYWFREHLCGDALVLVTKVYDCLNAGNHDRSDIQSDYFDVGWYVDINVGKWDRPYIVTA